MAENGLNCGINKISIMLTNITVPDIGDFENVEIIEILTKPGNEIKKNDPIVTLESDKSSVEVPSPFSGTVSKLKVKIGDKVSKGSILAIIESKDTNIVDKDNIPSRHLGVILRWKHWKKLYIKLENLNFKFLLKPKIRFKNEVGEQGTFFISDPSGNALEFKSFKNESMVFKKV